jgi:HAD superfamily hydrolase (TIGR01490 family)
LKPSIAFFDFDGTITKSDTLSAFIRFSKGSFKYFGGLIILAPALFAFKMGWLDRQKAKEKVLSYFFKGTSETDFNNSAKHFATKAIPGMLRPKAVNRLDWHMLQGHAIVIVSASPGNWVMPWCLSAGYGCIATKLSVAGGKITGNIEGLNCYGQMKVDRICEKYDLSQYHEIFAYGDSKGDLLMLKLANHQFFKPFG